MPYRGDVPQIPDKYRLRWRREEWLKSRSVETCTSSLVGCEAHGSSSSPPPPLNPLMDPVAGSVRASVVGAPLRGGGFGM